MRIAKLSLAFIVLALPFLAAAPAAAQATRTWVSGVGDDLAACSRTAPCKTFAAAIAVTAAGGEINCLDFLGGFGTLTITKSITILCEGVVGGVLASGGNSAIIINAATTDTVTLKGLDIDGGGAAGNVGINIQSASKVTILNTSIRNFRSNSGSVGVALMGTATITVNIQDSTILDNSRGIYLDSPGGYKIVNAKNVMITGSSSDGITAISANAYVNVFESVISNNGGHGVILATGTSTANIRRSQINNNIIGGIRTNGAGTLINISQSDFLNNTTAFTIVAGTIASDGLNNVVGAIGNNPNGTITLK